MDVCGTGAVHELGYGEMPRAVVFRGTKELQKAEVQAQLGLKPILGGGAGVRTQGVPGSTPRAGGAGGIGRYLLSVGEHDFALESAIEDLQVHMAHISRSSWVTGTL